MITLKPELFVNIVFGINAPDTDEYFKSLGTQGGNRYKAVPLELGVYLKTQIPETLIHVELRDTYAIIWDKDDWDLASHGHEIRQARRKAERERTNATIEDTGLIEKWVDKMMTDPMGKVKTREFWIAKLTGLYKRDGINKVREMLEHLAMTFHGNKDWFFI